jgi:hypothetical protein
MTIDDAGNVGIEMDTAPRKVMRRPPKSGYSNRLISPATAAAAANRPAAANNN